MLAANHPNQITDLPVDAFQFKNQVLLNSAGSGWKAIDATIQQSTGSESHWIQVQFPDRKKVFSIELHLEWNAGNGKYWIKYGDSIDSMQTYINPDGSIKVGFALF